MFSLICFENILYAYRIFTKIKNHVLDHKVNNVDTVEILLPPFSDRKVIKLEIKKKLSKKKKFNYLEIKKRSQKPASEEKIIK